MPEEQKALRKKEKRKDRLHQAYLRRKASDWQREYYARIKSEKHQKIEAKKAALRAEDMAKGVFDIAGNVPQQKPQKAAMPPRATAV